MKFTFPSELYKHVFGFLIILIRVELATCADNCDTGIHNCQYGCCNQDCCPYAVSTSVLIVAGIVGGLIVVALIIAIVVCCIRTYRDKRASRVRQLRPGQQHEDHIPRRPVEPRKPPEYTEAPPPYSSEIPESHFRPVTVSGHYLPYNQRFRTPVMQNYPHHNRTITTNYSGFISGSRDSMNPPNRHHARRIGVVGIPAIQEGGSQPSQVELPGAPISGPPPTYLERVNPQVEAQRRRRFITTPPQTHTVTMTVSEIPHEHTSESSNRRSVVRQSSESSVTTEDTTQSRHETTESRNDTASSLYCVTTTAGRQNNSNAASISHRVPETNDITVMSQMQTISQYASDSNSRQQRGLLSMEAAVSRARSRQINRQAAPLQAVSRRHTGNLPIVNDADHSDVEQLACL